MAAPRAKADRQDAFVGCLGRQSSIVITHAAAQQREHEQDSREAKHEREGPANLSRRPQRRGCNPDGDDRRDIHSTHSRVTI